MAATLSLQIENGVFSLLPGEKVAEGRGRMRALFMSFRSPKALRDIHTALCMYTSVVMTGIMRLTRASNVNSPRVRMTSSSNHARFASRATSARRGTGARAGAYLVALVACLLAAPVAALAQEQPVSTEPAFSVSSRQTYAPSQEPKIWISFRQVDHLDFRVYHVKDSVQFFSKLKDAHSFGSEKEELAREKTWLERFHDWKRDLRTSIRTTSAPNFSFETRWQYHSRVQERKLNAFPLTSLPTPRCRF